MISAAMTKDYGVIASDSAQFNSEEAKVTFESPKVSIVDSRYLVTFVGPDLYFSRLNLSKFKLPLKNLSLYLQGYLKEIRPDVKKTQEGIKDPEPDHFCMYVLGSHGKRPVLAQFNSFQDFAPRYLWSDDGIKFSTLLYADDTKPEKAQVFKTSTDFMNNLAQKYKEFSAGLVGEILTRGIYHKADLEEKFGDKKKYAGGVVNVAGITKEGKAFSLSGLEVVNG